MINYQKLQLKCVIAFQRLLCSETKLHLQVEAMPPAATAHALLCRDALLAITERVLTRSK